MTGPGRPEARSPHPWVRGLRRAGRAGNSETDVVVPVPGGVPVAVRGTQVLRFVVPPTSRPATPGVHTPPTPMHSRPMALPHSSRSSSPPPTPTRSRAHRAVQTRSTGTPRPESSSFCTGPCAPNRTCTSRCSSPASSISLRRCETAPSSPHAPRTPTPIHSTTGTPHPSSPTTNPHRPKALSMKGTPLNRNPHPARRGP